MSDKTSPTLPHTYTAKEVASILRIPRDEVYRMGDEIPGRRRVGRRVRWDAATIQDWLRGEAA